MSNSEELPNRKDRRLKGWRYTSGRYFITCNTHANKPLFGAVINGRMILNAAGKIAEACWRAIPEHFPSAQIDAFVIMPNHVHGIVQLSQGAANLHHLNPDGMLACILSEAPAELEITTLG
jgi:putative transposase